MVDAVKTFRYVSVKHIFAFLLILIHIASIASWHERPTLNPYELGSNRASHSGSKASLTSAVVHYRDAQRSFFLFRV